MNNIFSSLRIITYAATRLIIILIALNSNSWSQEDSNPLTIYAIELDHRLSENGDTQYNTLLSMFTASSKEKINIVIRPMSRSQISFKKDKDSCIFPATVNAMIANDPSIKSEDLISSNPIDTVSLRILTKTNTPTITSLQELNNKRIAVVNGLLPDALFSGINVNMEYTANEETRLKMLNANRINAVLGFVPDILIAAENLGIDVPSYSETLSLIPVEGVGLVCHNSTNATRFITNTNKTIDSLKNTGKMREILGPHADIVPIKQ